MTGFERARGGRVEYREESSLLEAVLAETKLARTDARWDRTRQAVEQLLSVLLVDESSREKEIDRPLVDSMIAEIEERISAQVNAILHHPDLQRLESAWRGLAFTVDRIDFAENVILEVLSVSKEDLRRDFDDSPEVASSGLHQQVYSREYGVFGGHPYGLVIADYEFGPDQYDLHLLGQCAAVSAMAHAIFVANAAPSFFGLAKYSGLPSLGELGALLEGPQYTAWRAFRETEDARYVGLCLPRFLLRLPYGAETMRTRTFAFDEETVEHEHYLWGHASYAFATRVADSFARYRWCPHIIGPNDDGVVRDMVLHPYSSMGRLQSKISTEAIITDRRELELSELGFIPFVHRKREEDACFFSAASVQKPRRFSDSEGGRDAEVSQRLGAQIPYMFVIARLAHYVKVKERELIATSRSALDVQRDLNEWIRNYVSDIDNPSMEIRAKRPLRAAQIEVREAEGQPGWFRCRISIKPHFKYMMASFTLALVGKIDRKVS